MNGKIKTSLEIRIEELENRVEKLEEGNQPTDIPVGLLFIVFGGFLTFVFSCIYLFKIWTDLNINF